VCSGGNPAILKNRRTKMQGKELRIKVGSNLELTWDRLNIIGYPETLRQRCTGNRGHGRWGESRRGDKGSTRIVN